jgi:organic hydroperoxide reductase OsmC/OhrA
MQPLYPSSATSAGGRNGRADLAEGGPRLAVAFKVRMRGNDAADAKEIVEAAHRICPYSNVTRGNPFTLEAA